MLERYGEKAVLKIKEYQDRLKQQLEDKYGPGFDNPSKIPEIVNKRNVINIEKWGFKCVLQNPDIQAKSYETIMEKYGCSNVSQNQEIKQKKRETCLNNFGYDNPMKHPQIFNKACKTGLKFKEFICPSGNILLVQGYEGLALNELINCMNISEIDIINSPEEVPTIEYIDNENKNHNYIPDIFIKSQNKIIEVKSGYTFLRDYSKNILKKLATINAGYNFEFWIYNHPTNNHLSEDEFMDVVSKNIDDKEILIHTEELC